MPLTVSPVGQEVVVMQMHVDDKVKRHLENLGFLVGERVTLLSDQGGNLIVRVRDSRVALSKGLGMRIFVEQ